MIVASRTLTSRTLAPTRVFSIVSDLSKKEKVEEDRYIRQKEHKDYLKRKAAEAPAVEQLSPEEEAAKQAHDDAVAEVFGILSESGCKVSDEAVENLAKCKLGMICLGLVDPLQAHRS